MKTETVSRELFSFNSCAQKLQALKSLSVTVRLSFVALFSITNSMDQSPLSEAKGPLASQEILCRYGTQKFITAFTRSFQGR